MSCGVCGLVSVSESRCIEVRLFIGLANFSLMSVYCSHNLTLFAVLFVRIFGAEGEEADNVTYTTWLNMLWAGSARALEMYSPASNKWLQVCIALLLFFI